MSKVVRKNVKNSSVKTYPKSSSHERSARSGNFVRHRDCRKGVTVSGNPPLPPKKK